MTGNVELKLQNGDLLNMGEEGGEGKDDFWVSAP